MDVLKFVPPGGHRACLNCSAAKAKCVFPEDGTESVADPLAGGMAVSRGSGLTRPGGDTEHDGGRHNDSAGALSSAAAAADSAGGTPAVPKCERCERLGRGCFLPMRPRKKRRVGSIRPGTSRAATVTMKTEPGEARKAASETAGAASPVRDFAPVLPSAAAAAAAAAAPTFVVPVPNRLRTSVSPKSRNARALQKPETANRGLHSGNHDNSLQQPQQRPHRNEPAPIRTTTQGLLRSPSAASSASSPRRAQSHVETKTARDTPLLLAADKDRANALFSSSPTNGGSGSLAPGTPSSHQPATQPSSLLQQHQHQRQRQHLPPPPAVFTPAQRAHHALINATLHMAEHEAEELLHFYRRFFSRFNPYMEGPAPDVKAAELQTRRPFVWLAIVFVTSYNDLEHQTRLAQALVSYLTDQVFEHGFQSLDLLQGLLTFLNWFIAQNFVLAQLTNLLYVAMALVSDLGLDKLALPQTTTARSPLEPYIAKTIHGPRLLAPEDGHTLDERRALAGVFCLSHAIGHTITLMTPLRYTLQLEETCRIFEAQYAASREAAVATAMSTSVSPATSTSTSTSTAASPSLPDTVVADYHLAIAVRFYHLIDRVLQTQSEADLCEGHFAVPVRTRIAVFADELDRLWSGLSPETQSDTVVKLLYHATNIYIHELGLTSSAASLKNERPYTFPAQRDALEASRTDLAAHNDPPIRCYMSVKSFFDYYLTIPVNIYHHLSVTMFCQVVHADLTLAKLTAFFRGNTCPVGVPPGVRLPAFRDIIEAVASRFQRAGAVPHPLGYPMRNVIFEAFAARVRAFTSWDWTGSRKAAAAAAAPAITAEPAAGTTRSPSAAAAAATARPSRPQPATMHGLSASTTRLSIENLVGAAPSARNLDVVRVRGGAVDVVGAVNAVDTMDVEEAPTEREATTTPEPSEAYAATDREATAAASAASAAGSPSATSAGDAVDTGEQAEWWAWFEDIQASLLGIDGVITVDDGGSVSGRSTADDEDRGLRKWERGGSGSGSGSGIGAGIGKGICSIGSIGSLLNNKDQEPNLDAYIQQRGTI
ncbi:zinc finger, mynd-type domain containing protein [Niveomyces insectorum RCEF 264]|uniref:Zinc finger, mynd-type domain containing protein n=1 Tax=Niveomyces insectorum RCEF 264 TaxID=1081102 RepID=A0A167XR77_9HYPO|nr:zinc finger, mynd-type domain containing protein [Niveomyces insectorum RCEF 264]